MKKFKPWDEYTDRVVIRKIGYFYEVWEESAHIISYLLNYKIGIYANREMTGCPKYEIMTRELKRNSISYVVFEGYDIVDEEDYPDNAYNEFVLASTNLGNDNYSKKITQNTSIKEIIEYNDKTLNNIETLLQGINPWTGECIDDSYLFNNDDMIYILNAAKDTIDKQNKKIKSKM